MNVFLRDLQPEDRDKLLQWRNLPEVRRWMYTDHEIQPEEHERWFADALINPAKRFWVIVHDGNDVGLANLDQINLQHRRCSWAFYLADPTTRGKHVGKKAASHLLEIAFQDLQLERLWCEALSTNKAAISLYESVGMRREGLLRNHALKADGYHDILVMGVLRSEWLNLDSQTKVRLNCDDPMKTQGHSWP